MQQILQTWIATTTFWDFPTYLSCIIKYNVVLLYLKPSFTLWMIWIYSAKQMKHLWNCFTRAHWWLSNLTSGNLLDKLQWDFKKSYFIQSKLHLQVGATHALTAVLCKTSLCCLCAVVQCQDFYYVISSQHFTQ